MIEYKTLTYSIENIQSLPLLGKENWNLCSIYDGKIFLSREVKRAVSKKEITDDIEFEEWYALYPKKESKHTALKAWHALSPEDRQSTKQLSLHIRYWKSKYGIKFSKGKEVVKDTTYIPLPASWLNGKKWNDEIEIDGKSKDQVQQEQDMIKKRVLEERKKEKKAENDRLIADKINDIIASLKRQGKMSLLLDEARKQSPEAPEYQIEYRARSIIRENMQYWENLIKL